MFYHELSFPGIKKLINKKFVYMICSIQSIICLNLPSFSGGFNPWGVPSKLSFRNVCCLFISLAVPPFLFVLHIFLFYISIFMLSKSWKNWMQKDYTPPFVDDGLLEVVGFRDAWHGLVLLAPNGHGTRLAQVSYIQTHLLNEM